MDHLDATFVTDHPAHVESEAEGHFQPLHEDDNFSNVSEPVLLSTGPEGIQLFLATTENNEMPGLAQMDEVSLATTSRMDHSPTSSALDTKEDAKEEVLQVEEGGMVVNLTSAPMDSAGFSVLPFTLAKDTHLVHLTHDGKVNLVPKSSLPNTKTPAQYFKEPTENTLATVGVTKINDLHVTATEPTTKMVTYVVAPTEQRSPPQDTLQNGAYNISAQHASMELSSLLTVSKHESAQRPTTFTVYPCPFSGCKKIFRTDKQLRNHRRQHTLEKPYACDFPDCKKSFSSRCTLQNHTRVHTGEKPFLCTFAGCTKAFKTSGDLQKHCRIHTGERPFECPFEGCKKSFTTSNIRKVHMRVHTGERPYKCEEKDCGKTFASATNYRNHQRIHTGERPYVCAYDNCGKRFTEYSSLYKHHVVHTQDKPYTCEHCNKTYRQASTLATHKRIAHNDNGESEPAVGLSSNSFDQFQANDLSAGISGDNLSGEGLKKEAAQSQTSASSAAPLTLINPPKEMMCSISTDQIVTAAFPICSLTAADKVYLISDPENLQLFTQLTSSAGATATASSSTDSVSSDQFINNTTQTADSTGKA